VYVIKGRPNLDHRLIVVGVKHTMPLDVLHRSLISSVLWTCYVGDTS